MDGFVLKSELKALISDASRALALVSSDKETSIVHGGDQDSTEHRYQGYDVFIAGSVLISKILRDIC
jgi:hypothetical protein